MDKNDKNIEKINIIFTIDDNYSRFLGVTLCSIFENKKCQNPIEIYVLDGGIQHENKEKLYFLSKKYNFEINFIKIDTYFFKNFKLTDYFTPAVYYRLIIPDLLPQLSKILYLDCDIIVMGDILELYRTNIDNYILAAVREFITDRQKDLGMPLDSKYFNSGVLLINTEKWKQEKITQKSIAYTKENFEKIKYCDQDVLNATIWDKWLEIPFKYNYMTSFIKKHSTKEEEPPRDILILHYSSNIKPWNYLDNHPYSKKYFYYLKKTPWKNKKFVNKNFKNIIIKLIRPIIIYLFPDSIINNLRKIKRFKKIKFF